MSYFLFIVSICWSFFCTQNCAMLWIYFVFFTLLSFDFFCISETSIIIILTCFLCGNVMSEFWFIAKHSCEISLRMNCSRLNARVFVFYEPSFYYNMSKKYWPILCSKLLHEMGQLQGNFLTKLTRVYFFRASELVSCRPKLYSICLTMHVVCLYWSKVKIFVSFCWFSFGKLLYLYINLSFLWTRQFVLD